MKKYFKILFFLGCLLPLTVQAAGELNSQDSFQVAKAFKLGRDVQNLSSVSAESRTVSSKNSRTVCTSSQYIKDGECVSCPSNAKCNGHIFTCKKGYTKASDGKSCITATTYCSSSMIPDYNCYTIDENQYTKWAGEIGEELCEYIYKNSGTMFSFVAEDPTGSVRSNHSCSVNCSSGYYKVSNPTMATADAVQSAYLAGLGYSSSEAGRIVTAYLAGDEAICLPCPNNATCNGQTLMCNDKYTTAYSGTACEPEPIVSSCASGFYLWNNPTMNTVQNLQDAYLASLINSMADVQRAQDAYFEGNNVCLSCPNNATCAGGTASFVCDSGYQKNSIGVGCEAKAITCNAGYYNNNGTCTACPKGTYASSAGSSSCTPCPAGTYYNWTGGTACKPCPRGMQAPSEGMSVCQDCPKGTYASTTGNASCTACPKGTYVSSAGNSSCTACPDGETTGSTGNKSASACYSDNDEALDSGNLTRSGKCPGTGLTYVAGRGCCTAAALADPQQQCFQEATDTMLAE